MRVGLLIIATNGYADFAKNLLESADKYFLPECPVDYIIFTNRMGIKFGDKARIIQIMHESWPAMTLYRYHIFCKHEAVLRDYDILIYCDADMLFVDKVGNEIFGPLIMTKHPGYWQEQGAKLPHESRKKSKAYVWEGQRFAYFAGGFNGGLTNEFLKMSKEIKSCIDEDKKNGIVAVWNDESHMNRYAVSNKYLIKILDPSYCYPENDINYCLPFKPRIVALEKDHSKFQV